MLPVRLNDLKYLKEALDPSKPLFLDTETCFLYKGIRLVQMFQKGWSEVLIFDTATESLANIILCVKNCRVVCHNYVFDASCISEDLNLKSNPFETFEDTLLLSRIAFVEKDSFSLDKCFEYVYGVDVYAQFGLDKKTMQKSFLSTKRRDGMKIEVTNDQLQYAAADVYYMPKLWDILEPYTQTPHYLEDKEFIHNSLKWQSNGMPVNLDLRKKLEAEAVEKVNELTQKLPDGLNVNSFIQVRNFLGSAGSAKDDLMRMIAEGNENAALVMEKRKTSKLLNFLERYNFERVRGFFAPTAISGRARCDGGDEPGTDNLLQIPRKLKGVFGYSEGDSRYLVYCDYAQLELRTACCNTNEKVIEKVFRDNLDLHTYTAVKMFPGLTYEEAKADKVKRHAAKTCNFSLLYCGSTNSLKDVFLREGGVSLTVDQAAGYRTAWLSAYPAFEQWHRSAMEKYRKDNLLCETKNGRRYKAKLFTDICGIENQSLGADAAKHSLNIFCKRYPNAKVLCFIHDAIILEAQNEEEAKSLSKALGECMLEGWFYAIRDLPINDLPMPLEVNYGKNLATIESENIGWQTNGLKEDLAQTPQKPLFEEKKVENTLEYKPPKELLGRDILFDADTILYIAAYENEANSFEAALDYIKEYFKFTRKLFEAKSLKLFLTTGKCFRYDLWAEYKANRSKVTPPKHVKALKEYCAKNFSNVIHNPLFEADDLIVEAKKKNPETLLFAIDKDILNSLPGIHFNPKKREIVEVKEFDAMQWPYIQAISGDSSDNIPGVRNLGSKKAVLELVGANTHYEMWQRVENAFTKHGYTKEDALLSMRLVNMHQCNNGKLELFNPPKEGE